MLSTQGGAIPWLRNSLYLTLALSLSFLSLSACSSDESGSPTGSTSAEVVPSEVVNVVIPPSASDEVSLPEVEAFPDIRPSWRRIIIDAGHGGHDHGATGVSGAHEKEVTLGISRACARELRALGFDVIETRTEDEPVRLERRSALANARGAGIFVSIHANSAGRGAVEGVETYYMDLASDEAASRLAERENRARSVAGDPSRDGVDSMIADLEMGAYAKQSKALAAAVHQQLVSGLQEFYGEKRIKDRGVRTAPFWVLLDSQMPAILVEVGYLTNRREERRLRTHGFQRHAARAIATAVAEFAEQAEASDPSLLDPEGESP